MTTFRQSINARSALIAGAAMLALATSASAGTLWSNGFESNANGWFALPGTATRVASGTGGITSASGNYHAQVTGGAFTRWGEYNFGAGGATPTAFKEYTTSLDIYLDMNVSAANDSRFNYTSAINKSDGSGHLRDFVFTGGFYNTDSDNRFVISASNNTPGWPSDPGRSPITIRDTGWYTFQHRFFNNGGVLAVEMKVLDSVNMALGTWLLSNPGDLIGLVGGNRYGWFPTAGNAFGFSSLAIDNASISVVPLPPAGWAGLATLAGVMGVRAVRRRRQLA